MRDKVDILKSLYRDWSGVYPASIEVLPGAGSQRKYYRLSSPGKSAIGVLADNFTEARAFIRLSVFFRNNGINVPEIFNSYHDSVYLQQDLGDTDLLSMIQKGEDGLMPEQIMSSLPKMQLLPECCWSSLVAFRPFSNRLVKWDLNYFKYEFLKPSGVGFDEDKLEDDFQHFADILCGLPQNAMGFQWRDCQSRNIMINDNKPYFIDYQGGRKGPAIYDAVSFVWQAKAAFPYKRKMELLDSYMEEFSNLSGIDRHILKDIVPFFSLFRMLQVLGAYGFRGLVEHKAHFVQSIPQALANLSFTVECGWVDIFPELKKAATELSSLERFMTDIVDNRLHIKVFSFSYKKGYPEDLSGNGGGFMFDCRGMNNPGRYAEFKHLTGLDLPVKNFLKNQGEIEPFILKAFDLVSPTVENYLRRGFRSLQIGFGCTGGHHRSVYSAQAIAEMLAQKYPEAIIDLCHREHNIHRVFNKEKIDRL